MSNCPPLFVSYILPIKGTNDLNTLLLVIERMRLMTNGHSFRFTFDNQEYQVSLDTNFGEIFTIQSMKTNIIDMISGEAPLVIELQNVINRIIIKEVHES